MSNLQRERELRRLEASLGVDKSVEGESSPASKLFVPEPVEQTKPVLKKVAVVSEQIINQTTAVADEALKRLPNITLSRARKKSLYICAGAALLVGAGALAFNFMDDKNGSAGPAVAIAPSQGLYIPPAVNQVPTLPGRVQEEERKPVAHSEEAIPQGLPLIEEAAPHDAVQPPVSSADEDKGGVQKTVPAQAIAPAPAAAPQVRPAKNDSEAKAARPPAVVAAPRVIQRYQPPPASDKEIKAEVERVEAGKPWQSKIDQIKDLDL
ncbi:MULTISPECIES: hypothetical protein [unclassified Stenotrophomonas]|uniref:hypothetical protein n=1 Tax=unclassified Stenotrophomonas TaxID=196198 RepID=UPI00244AFF5A|nr:MULTISPECIES: hypothetical protein [unclassified Stenotrophomonas]MDG9843077.1 hypothetical protein [Stenotrophomonas sp. GD04054]MDH0015883.1 hypothetical protein [Stenotrophomonas sp. GD04028]MDH0575667.1 hypothetical protein [Stenotrophomonas sp. GD03997]MDH0859587.1 hypothetical protein [Stenotrophomonas sp. GD03882]